MIFLGYVRKYLYVIFGNLIRKVNNMYFIFFYFLKSVVLMKKYYMISFIFFKEMVFFLFCDKIDF